MSKEMIKKTLAIEDIEIVATEESSKYAYARIWALGASNNSHRNPISEEVLTEYGHTSLNAPVICKYDNFLQDVTTHTNDQKIVGTIPANSKVQYVRNKDGVLFMVLDAIIYKLYNVEIWEMFRKDNFRSVSCEFMALEGEEDMNGDTPILEFDICGITILGKDFKPSCPNAEMEIYQFSQKEAEDYYVEHQIDALRQFAEGRYEKQEMVVSYKVDKSKDAISTSSWGDVDKTTLRNKIMEASNRDSLVKDVYLEVETGWQDAPSDHLKYPVMQFKDDTLVYNKQGISSALGNAKAENKSSVVNKATQLQEKLDLKEEGDNKTMSEVKKEMGYNPKTFSYDMHADSAALDAMLKRETEDYREIAERTRGLWEKGDLNIVMDEFVKVSVELAKAEEKIKTLGESNETLVQFKAEIEEKQKEEMVDTIMEAEKENLTDKEYEDFKEEGKSLQGCDIEVFENKVKAKAYSNMKAKAIKASVEVPGSEVLSAIPKPKAMSKPNNSKRTIDDIIAEYNK